MRGCIRLCNIKEYLQNIKTPNRVHIIPFPPETMSVLRRNISTEFCPPRPEKVPGKVKRNEDGNRIEMVLLRWQRVELGSISTSPSKRVHTSELSESITTTEPPVYNPM